MQVSVRLRLTDPTLLSRVKQKPLRSTVRLVAGVARLAAFQLQATNGQLPYVVLCRPDVGKEGREGAGFLLSSTS